MKNAVSVVVLTALVGVQGTCPLYGRTWTDRDGRTVEADFVTFESGKVRIKRATDGKSFDVPLARLSDRDQEYVQARASEVISRDPWVEEIVGRYDPRLSAEKRLARGMDEGFKEAFTVWQEGFQETLKESPSSVALLQFLWDYDPIWADDKYQTMATETRLARMKQLSDKDIADWQKVLKVVQEDDVNELWTIGLMVDTPSLFLKGEFDSTRSRLLLQRLSSLPQDSTKALAKLIKKTSAEAAIAIATNETFFDSEEFGRAEFGETIAELRKHLAQSRPDGSK